MITDIATIQPTAPIGPAFPQMDVVPVEQNCARTLFQAGTEPSQLQSLIERYQQQELSESEAKIKLPKIVLEAKQTLPREQFAEFCMAVDLNPKSSKLRKLLKIGQNASRFDLYPGRIPPNWTTQYKLAALKPEQFDRVLANPNFNADSTADDIDHILNDPKAQGPASAKPAAKPDFTISFDTIDDNPTKLEISRKFEELAEQYGLTYHFSAKIERLRNPRLGKPVRTPRRCTPLDYSEGPRPTLEQYLDNSERPTLEQHVS